MLPANANRTSGADGPVRMRMRQVGDQTHMEMGVDYTRAAIPDRAYYADYCQVTRARIGYNLTFGKLSEERPTLRTKIEIIFPEQMFQRQLWASSASIRQTVQQVVGNRQLESATVAGTTDKIQTFRSNNVFMALWGDEAILDFYYISPRDFYLFRTQHGADIGLEPIVRVSMETILMKEFFNQCSEFVVEEANETAESALSE